MPSNSSKPWGLLNSTKGNLRNPSPARFTAIGPAPPFRDVTILRSTDTHFNDGSPLSFPLELTSILLHHHDSWRKICSAEFGGGSICVDEYGRQPSSISLQKEKPEVGVGRRDTTSYCCAAELHELTRVCYSFKRSVLLQIGTTPGSTLLDTLHLSYLLALSDMPE